ncbi:hypothetical protein ACFL2Q_19030, partial [Thermodesulfobacteriota bacterium]
MVPRLERAVGAKISYSSVHLTWRSVDSVRISFGDLEILQESGAIPALRMPSAAVEVHFLPLLKGVFYIERMDLVRPMLFVALGPGKNRVSLESGRAAAYFSLRPVVGKLEIIDGRIRINTFSDSNGPTETVIRKIS